MHLLITAGPTREPLDPVRYLTNRSSGRMGYALAAAAARLGHHVLLVSGPTALDVPPGVDFIPVESALEMFEAVGRHLAHCEIAICAAAVADYRPAAPAATKIRKSAATLRLDLVPNPDILGSARGEFGFAGTLVGFAAETENLAANARDKLVRKRCDLIVANDVSRRDIGFDAPDNEVLLVYSDHTEALPKLPKEELAEQILETAILLHARKTNHTRST
jgi:phosphopantothenoylcysteine synthetase/decarboxylase